MVVGDGSVPDDDSPPVGVPALVDGRALAIASSTAA